MFVLFKMAADNAARRLQQLNVSLKLGVNNTVFLRQYVTAGGCIEIGNVGLRYAYGFILCLRLVTVVASDVFCSCNYAVVSVCVKYTCSVIFVTNKALC